MAAMSYLLDCHPERSPSDEGARTESKDPGNASFADGGERHSLEYAFLEPYIQEKSQVGEKPVVNK
jgi:hypothetical protein